MTVLKNEYYTADPLNAAYSTGETVKHLYACVPVMSSSDATILAMGLSGDTCIRNIIGKSAGSFKIHIYSDNGNREIKKEAIIFTVAENGTVDFTGFRNKTLRELASVENSEDPIGGYTVGISPSTTTSTKTYFDLTLSR